MYFKTPGFKVSKEHRKVLEAEQAGVNFFDSYLNSKLEELRLTGKIKSDIVSEALRELREEEE